MAQAGINSNGYVLNIGTTIDQGQIKKCKAQLDKFKADAEKNGKIDITINYDKAKGTKTQIEQITTATGEFAKVVSKLNAQGVPLEQVITSVGTRAKNTSQEVGHLNSSLQKLNATGQRSKNIFDDFSITFLKMIKFNTINKIYDSFTQSLGNAVEMVEEFNKATTELKKVSDLEGDSLKSYTEELAKYGEAVGRSMTDMVNSATIFKRTGATDEDALRLAQIAELYRNVADSEITSAEAASFLVSQMKAFNITADQSVHIIDAINKTANEHAVSTNDLQIALSKSAAAMATAGNTYEETIAMVEGATAVMQNNAGTVGNGLRTIAINIANLATQSDEFVAANGKVNISLKDERGEIRSTYEILNDLSQSWNKLSTAEQNEIAVSLAGKTRYNVLTSLMRNFSDAQQTYADALNSTNSAWEENSRYMESIAAKQAKLQAEIQRFVLGDGGLEALEKKLLDIGTAVIKFINDIGGLKNVLTVISTVVLIGLLNNFDKLYKSTVAFLNNTRILIATFLEAKTSGLSFSDSLKMIGISASTTQLALQGIVAVIGLVIVAYNAYKQVQEEAKEAAREANQNALDNLDTARLQIANLTKENQSREDLIKAIQAVDGSYKDEKQSLDELNAKRDETIKKIKEQTQAELEAARNEGFGQRQKDQRTLESGWMGYRVKLGSNLQRAMATTQGSFKGDSSEEYLQYLTQYQKHLTDVGRSSEQLNKVIRELRDEINDAKGGISAYDYTLLQLGQAYDTTTHQIKTLLPAEQAQNNILEESQSLNEAQTETLKELGVSLEEVNDKMNESDTDAFYQALASGDLETAKQLLVQYGIEVDNVDNKISDLVSEFDNLIQPLSSIENNYSILQKAMKEFNTQGGISASTLKKLTELDAQWVNLLELQNGKLVVNEQSVQALANAEKQEAIATLQAQASQDMLNVALGNYNALSPLAQQAISGVTTKNKEEAESAKEAAASEFLHAEAIKAKKMAEGSYEGDPNEAQRNIDAIMASYEQWINKINSWNLDMADSSKSSAGAHKDAWVEAFKEEQRQLKHALETNEITEYEYYERLKELNEKYFGEISGKHQKYIKEYQENEEEIYKGLKSVYDKVKDYLKEAVEQGYEDAINALKKEEKNVLAEIKKQIEAIKNEKQSVIKGIEKQINALKREKEAVQKSYNAQIDAIKRENEELQKQNELLEYQQALEQAKAQKVMVMKDGRFQLSENESAVAQAEQNLGQYQEQLSYEQQIQQLEDLRDAQVESIEARIESLEEYKDYMEEYYDEQIEAMENYYNQVQEQYEKQIDALQEQLDAFKAGYKKSEDLENARLATQVLGANEEASIWAQRLKNLAKAVTEYNKILALAGKEGVGASSAFEASAIDFEPSSLVNEIDTSVKHRASGDASFASDEVALVGESPNAELVIGSQINRSVNNGSLVHLSKGSGVVNAESTRTLAGLLNGLGNTSNVSNSRLTNQNFNFGNITLPNVTDANSFVNTLSQKFNNYAIQYSNTRK